MGEAQTLNGVTERGSIKAVKSVTVLTALPKYMETGGPILISPW